MTRRPGRSTPPWRTVHGQPVGTLAIEQVLGHKGPLIEVVGRRLSAEWHGQRADVICLPHPSGASTWHKLEPGATLLGRALAELSRHPDLQPLRS